MHSVTFNDQFDVGCMLKQKFHHDEITETPWRGILSPIPHGWAEPIGSKSINTGIPEFKRAEDLNSAGSYKESYFANLENVHFAYNLKSLNLRQVLSNVSVSLNFKLDIFISIENLRTLYWDISSHLSSFAYTA